MKKGGADPRGTTLSRKRVSILGSDEIEKIYQTYCFIFRKEL